jgi:predicted DNA-binding transcriptional regulator AlpA
MSAAVASDHAPPAGTLAPMLDVADVAAIFSIEPDTCRDWIQRGRLPRPVRIGRTIRWPKSVIEQFVAALIAGTVD